MWRLSKKWRQAALQKISESAQNLFIYNNKKCKIVHLDRGTVYEKDMSQKKMK